MISASAEIFNAIVSWIWSTGWKAAAIVLLAYLVHGLGRFFIEKTIRRVVIGEPDSPPEAERKREDTLIRIFSSTSAVVIWIVAVMMVLQTVGVAIGPLLATAGIAGLAVGFGGQYLIRDLFSGLFIIMENQYRVGDVICVDGTCGKVEDITLRMTSLRDMDGTVHHVPHGEIKKVSNLSKQFARVNLNVGVSYASDLDHVIAVINRVGGEMSEDPLWKQHIIKQPVFNRVDKFGDSAIEVKITGETQPLKQWDVTGELRKRLKVAFDREGIEIPFPQRVVHTRGSETRHRG